jgi:predicted RNA methylase
MQEAFDFRHGIESQPVLTIADDETAHLVAGFLDDRIAGKTVVEIGGGLGLLSLHMGFRAKRVFCIEANPIWAAGFATSLLDHKPKNVSYLFGAADEFSGVIRADVAVFCTHSGVESMRSAAALFAPVVIDVHGEIIASNPERFDRLARALRPYA